MTRRGGARGRLLTGRGGDCSSSTSRRWWARHGPSAGGPSSRIYTVTCGTFATTRSLGEARPRRRFPLTRLSVCARLWCAASQRAACGATGAAAALISLDRAQNTAPSSLGSRSAQYGDRWTPKQVSKYTSLVFVVECMKREFYLVTGTINALREWLEHLPSVCAAGWAAANAAAFRSPSPPAPGRRSPPPDR